MPVRTFIVQFMFLLLLNAVGAVAVQADCTQPCSPRVARLLHKIGPMLEAGQNRDALERLEGFVVRHPQETYFLIDYYRGNLYAGSGRNEDALDAYSAALTGCATDAGLWRNHAKVAWDLERYAVAADSLRKAYDLLPDNELLFNIAVASSRAGDIEQALAILEQLLDTGKIPEVWLETYVGLCQNNGMGRRALLILLDRRAQLEGRPKYWQLRAMLHVQLEQYAKGAAALQALAALEPLSRNDKKLLADLLLQIDIPLQAAEVYAGLLAENPQDMELRRMLVSSYRLGLQPRKALDVIEQARSLGKDKDLLRCKAEISFDLELYEQAYEDFGALLQLDPEYGPAYLYRGYAALHLGEHDNARRALRQALRFKREKNEAQQLLVWLKQS